MEDTLRGQDDGTFVEGERVLILVLMEDTLRVIEQLVKNGAKSVLILVLMEDTLREQRLMFLCIRVFGVCSSF